MNNLVILSLQISDKLEEEMKEQAYKQVTDDLTKAFNKAWYEMQYEVCMLQTNQTQCTVKLQRDGSGFDGGTDGHADANKPNDVLAVHLTVVWYLTKLVYGPKIEEQSFAVR